MQAQPVPSAFRAARSRRSASFMATKAAALRLAARCLMASPSATTATLSGYTALESGCLSREPPCPVGDPPNADWSENEDPESLESVESAESRTPSTFWVAEPSGSRPAARARAARRAAAGSSLWRRVKRRIACAVLVSRGKFSPSKAESAAQEAWSTGRRRAEASSAAAPGMGPAFSATLEASNIGAALVVVNVAAGSLCDRGTDPAPCPFKIRMSADGLGPSPTFVCRGTLTLGSGPTGRKLLGLGRLGTERRLAPAEQFLDLGLLANLLADVVELGAADLAVAENFYLLDAR